MIKILSTTECINLLVSDKDAGWSLSGAEALIYYLEDLEDALDKPLQFDTVAIRCEYSEYSDILEAAQNYGFIPENDQDEDEIESAALAYLEYRTTVIRFSGGIILQEF